MWIQRHLGTLAGIFLTALYIYLQLVQWQKHGDDLTPIAASMTVTVVLWGLLIWSFARYRRDSRQVLRQEPEIHSETRQPAFHVLNADWGNAAVRKPLTDVIEKMPLNALAFHVGPYTFMPYAPDRADPAQGDDNKYVEITYEASSGAVSTITRKQGEWVILPEDLSLRNEVDGLRKALAKRTEEYSAQITELHEQLRKTKPAPIVFGDATQGIAAIVGARWLSWWHVPVTANKELRACTVEIAVDNYLTCPGLWSVGHGEKPQHRIDLIAGDTVNIPIAARSEHDGMRLSGHPILLPDFLLNQGTAILTDDQVISHGATVDRTLHVGTRTIRLTVVSGGLRFESVYLLFVPDKEIGNGQFYMRNPNH